MIAAGSRMDRARIATIAAITAGYSEVGLQLFFISQVLVSDKAQIYFYFRHVENHCLSPCFL